MLYGQRIATPQLLSRLDVSYRKPYATVGCHTLALQEAEDLVRLYSALGLAPPNDAL